MSVIGPPTNLFNPFNSPSVSHGPGVSGGAGGASGFRSYSRFPQASKNPAPNAEDLAKAFRVMQTATEVTIPRLASLPSEPKLDQILILDNGVSTSLKWWNGSAWKTLTVS